MRKLTPQKLPFVFLLLLANLIASAQKKNFAVDKKEPAWIEKITTTNQKLTNRDIQEGYYLSLYEQQNNIETQEVYTHIIREIASDNGVQNGSEISVTYDPSYQKLIFNKIVIWRNNQAIDKLNASAFKVIQNETELSRFIYSGTYNAYLILDDVRKGDRIEYACTLKGTNPVFGNSYSNTLYFEGGSKIVNLYTNLVAKKDRVLQFKNFNAVPPLKTKERGDLKVYEWQSRLTNTFKTQDFEPSWYDPLGRVQVSEYKNWKDIVDWGLQINQYDLSKAPFFNAKAKELKEKAKGNAASYLELATRFVQDEVRYMGIEMGEYSHRPNSPEKVLKQRYGDCKDKSILLINLLRANGLSAYPVYVNTYLGDKTRDILPTPGAFNHAVVLVEFEGQKIWIDPTISDQRGPIKNIYFPYSTNVLVIKPGNDKLEAVKSNAKGKLSAISTIKLADTAGKTTELDIKTVYTANYADNIRSQINSSGANELEKSFLEYYTKFYPGIAAVKNMEIIDDEKSNTVTLIEKYEIEDMWTKDDSASTKVNANFYGDMVSAELRKLAKSRNFPLALKYPVNVQQEIRVVLPEAGWNLDSSEGGIHKPYYDFSYNIKQETDTTLVLKYNYANLTEEVPASDIAQYIKDRSKIINDIVYTISWGKNGTSGDIEEQNGLMIAIGVFTLIVVAAACIFIYYRKQNFDLEEIKNALPIGGWLVLIAVGLIFSPLGLLYTIFSNGTFAQSSWNVANNLNGNGEMLFKATLIFECVVNVSTYVFSIFMLIMFFKRRRSFPNYFIFYRTFYLTITIIDVVLMALLNAKTDLNFDIPKNIASLFGQVIVSAIWITYFIRSSRVKQTFVFTYPTKDWRNALIMDLSRNINVPFLPTEGQSIQDINEQRQKEDNEGL